MLRLTIHQEELQDTQKSSACFLNPETASQTTDALTKAGVNYSLEEVDAQPFYTIDIGHDKGGCFHSLRTEEECVALLSQIPKMTGDKAEALFTEILKNPDTCPGVTINPTNRDEDFHKAAAEADFAEIQDERYQIISLSGTKKETQFQKEEEGLLTEVAVTPGTAQEGLDGEWNFLDQNGEFTSVYFLHLSRKPGQPDPEKDQDTITNILLRNHKAYGMDDVKKLLRMAVANFSAEYQNGENTETDTDPDTELLAELAEAIQTPCHLH